MKIIESPTAMAAYARDAHARGASIAFVPTMGFLHEGHLSLMREGRKRGDVLVASIFVNPLQFGPGEDLDRYPRDPEGDAAGCLEAGVDVIFQPVVADLYPDGFQTTVRVGGLTSPLCGASRPGHFDGVTTVVLKLLHLVRPDVAIFGQKDYQQLAVIRRMVRDLDLPVSIVGLATVREPDGLAMSSRNAYLSPEQREQARALSASLTLAERRVAGGERDVGALKGAVRALIDQQPLARIDYVELLGADDLATIDRLERAAVLALAVYFGGTRLIDNRVLVP
jgi:pantoate--beta-alanine ligase